MKHLQFRRSLTSSAIIMLMVKCLNGKIFITVLSILQKKSKGVFYGVFDVSFIQRDQAELPICLPVCGRRQTRNQPGNQRLDSSLVPNQFSTDFFNDILIPVPQPFSEKHELSNQTDSSAKRSPKKKYNCHDSANGFEETPARISGEKSFDCKTLIGGKILFIMSGTLSVRRCLEFRKEPTPCHRRLSQPSNEMLHLRKPIAPAKPTHGKPMPLPQCLDQEQTHWNSFFLLF
ncbi:unnamed protein product [Ceratitis capitata]|uniref:(Mediterranean fruit fly) hypothetical protein n=1 Tax=Ceratitis capitata TaxID=7213 RepID=A0A811V6R8_CERCA|nr:unnamed protein product [Ceratitis capitata]